MLALIRKYCTTASLVPEFYYSQGLLSQRSFLQSSKQVLTVLYLHFSYQNINTGPCKLLLNKLLSLYSLFIFKTFFCFYNFSSLWRLFTPFFIL